MVRERKKDQKEAKGKRMVKKIIMPASLEQPIEDMTNGDASPMPTPSCTEMHSDLRERLFNVYTYFLLV